jgi:hypothetical protein
VSPEPTGSIVNSMINVDDETDKSISLTVLTKNEQGAVVNTDTRTVPDGESYYNEVTGLEAGNYTVEFMSGQTVLKTLTVNVAICEPEPELTDVTVTAGCGYVVVTNPNSVPVTFAYGSFSNPKEDGKTLVFPGEPVKVPTTRTSLDWVAYDAATGEPAGMGAGTIKVKQDCDTPPGPKPPKPPQVPDNPKHPKPPFKPHTPPTKVDVCKNVGMQSSVPAGYYRASNGYCYKIPSSTVPHTGGGSSAAIMQAANAETPISPWWATIGIGMAIAGGAALRSKRVQEWARI